MFDFKPKFVLISDGSFVWYSDNNSLFLWYGEEYKFQYKGIYLEGNNLFWYEFSAEKQFTIKDRKYSYFAKG